MLKNQDNYDLLIGNIGNLLHQGRQQAATTVNSILVQTYWLIGQYIVEYEQKGHEKQTMARSCSTAFPKT